MKSNKIYIFAALLGIALVGCQKVEEQATTDNNPIDKNGWKITVKASKEIDTKALALDGTTLKGYWKDGEKVSVYFGGTLLGTLEATVGSPNTSATLSGEIEKPEELTGWIKNDNAWCYFDDSGAMAREAERWQMEQYVADPQSLLDFWHVRLAAMDETIGRIAEGDVEFLTLSQYQEKGGPTRVPDESEEDDWDAWEEE